MTYRRPNPKLPDMVSLSGAGNILNVSKQYVHKLAARGELVGTRLDGDGAWAFRKDYIEYMASVFNRSEAADKQ